MYCGTPTFWQRGLWDSCFQNPSESSVNVWRYITTPYDKLIALRIGNPKRGTLVNSEDPDEIPCAISSRSALFAKTKSIFRERNITFFGILTYDPSIYTMDHPDLTV